MATESSYPARPQSTDRRNRNCFWPDGSRFCFDLSPRNVMWGWDVEEEGGIYDIPTGPRVEFKTGCYDWGMWLEKFQKDYRFANLSDANARANLFPEVHDPWMFCEYVYQGKGKASDDDAEPELAHSIVAPPLYHPLKLQRTWSGTAIQSITRTTLNNQPASTVPEETEPFFDVEAQWESVATHQRYWEGDLAVKSWVERLPNGELNRNFTKVDPPVLRRVISVNSPMSNSGVKLHHANLWVQATHWGESQNVPERTVTLTAPKEWFNPEGYYTGRIVPQVTIRWGIPLYDNLTDAAAAQGEQRVVRYVSYGSTTTGGIFTQPVTLTPIGAEGQPDSSYSYPLAPGASSMSALAMPRRNLEKVNWNQPDYTDHDLIHHGCEFWKGSRRQSGDDHGTVGCTYRETQPEAMVVPHPEHCARCSGTTVAERQDAYRKAGGRCPFYSPHGVRVLGSYSIEASNGSEWANLQRGLPAGYQKTPGETQAGQTAMSFMGLGGLGFGTVGALSLAALASATSPTPYTSGLPKEDYQRIEINWVPEKLTPAGKASYYDTATGLPASNRDPEADLRIRAGQDQFILDEKTRQPYGGVDTPFFSYVNQINYRILHNVMHCYRQSECSKLLAQPEQAPGWMRGRYSAVNFKTHAWRMPGYPGLDGTDRFCHYSSRRCPYNALNRRAVEYNENLKILLKEILGPFRAGGIQAFAGAGLQEAFVLADGTLTLATDVIDETGNVKALYANAWCAAVRVESASVPLLGHWQAVSQGYRIFFFYDRPSFDTLHRRSTVLAHLPQFDDEAQPCYMPRPEADVAALQKLFATAQVPWLVELPDDYREPQGNVMYVTNNRPFAGGRHPEYKDHSKMGRELRCRRGGYQDNSFRTGATDSNQFGGPLWNQAPVGGQVQESYWTDRYGEWILDGRRLGAGQELVDARGRMRNKPPRVGDAVPICGEPGISLQDPENPQANRNGDWASVGYVYSNDTAAYVSHLQDTWEIQLPDDPFTEEPVRIQPPNGEQSLLPRERIWYRCNVCGIDYPQEEVNDFVARGWYPSNDPQAPCACPRQDGGVLLSQGSYDRFMNCYARGQVQLWAPPGTTVRHDAYVWKNPTLINRMHKDQLLWKLGSSNWPGGGFSGQGLDKELELMGRLPMPVGGRRYVPGLNRQIVTPWAMPGEAVTAVRTRLATLFNLQSGDVAYAVRAGNSSPVQVDTESAFVLQEGDQLQFWRQVGSDLYRVGLALVATAAAPQSLLNEPVVKKDLNTPDLSKYEDSDAGRRLYNRDLQRWLLGIVANTMQLWSSSVYAHPNLLKATLQKLGYSGKFAEGCDVKPKILAQPITQDERVVGPYAEQDKSSLKMLNLPEFKWLRNRLLPALAYDLNAPHYTAGGDYTPTAQGGHNDRFRTTDRPLPLARYGTIPPQVLAATSSGDDYYVEWEVGDLSGTKARAYYPVGSTWWRLNQKVGQIRRHGGTNPLHLDDAYWNRRGADLDSGMYPQYGGESPWSYNDKARYTGDTISSAVAFFLHGRLPMDKEVVRAYLIYTHDDAPSMEAIGPQGQFTGNVGYQDLYGNLNNPTYRGNAECFWQHYHGYITNHESNFGGYGKGDSYCDSNARNHVMGHSGAVSPDNPQIPFLMSAPMDDPTVLAAAPDSWLAESVSAEDFSTEDYEPFATQSAEIHYNPHVSFLGKRFDNFHHSMGGVDEYLAAFDFEDVDAILTNAGSEVSIWKDLGMQDYLSRFVNTYRVEGLASVNTLEARDSFTYYARSYRNEYFPWYHQPIHGWIQYQGYDNADRFDRVIPLDAGAVTEPILLAASATPGATHASVVANDDPGGGDGENQAGSQPRMMDITAVIRRIYNDRVPRFYRCQLGQPLATFFTYASGQTDSNLGLAARFHSGSDDPNYFWNYRYFKVGAGMWLTDPWHMPPLTGEEIQHPLASGEELSVTDSDRLNRIRAVSDWDHQNRPADDPESYRYHPRQLLGVSATFIPSSPTGIKPVPQEDSDKYWRVLSDRPDSQYFEMDLRQVPYELSRRPWRIQPPQIDAANATCPNPSCFLHDKGWTMGQVYEMSQGTWGLGLVPSLSSPNCPNCHSRLEHVIELPGDGLTTIQYDADFAPDALVTALEIAIAGPWKPALQHGFVVEAFHSQVRQWRPLLSVGFNSYTNRYEYLEWDGSAWQSVSSDILPVLFKGSEGVGGTPKAGTSGVHFVYTLAQRLRLRVLRPAVEAVSEPADFGMVTSVGVAKQIIRVPALDEPLDHYPGRSIQLRDPSKGELRQTKVLQAEAVPGGGVDLSLLGPVESRFTQYRLVYHRYVSRCQRFRVYGYSYRSQDLTVTPPGMVRSLPIGVGNNEFSLTDRPTQICQLSVQVGDFETVPMQEVDGQDTTTLHWTAVRETFGPGPQDSYLRLTGGGWFYDTLRNVIVLPSYYRDPDDGTYKSVWALNQNLYNDASRRFNLPTLPLLLQVEYFVGAGVGVTVPVEAVGPGPSYQLEPECVSFIAKHSENDDVTLPPGVISDLQALPTMGQSVKLATHHGQRYPIKWQVYNHEPLVWDPEHGLKWLVGDELRGGNASDSAILDLFTGNRGGYVSDCNGRGALYGTVKGHVTLYGSPNSILSGELAVYAKAVTHRSYHFADGTTVDSYERTGGWREGCFVFRLESTQPVHNNRTGLSCNVPRVLVFLRERDSRTPV